MRSGASVVHVATEGKLLGLIAIADPIRDSTPQPVAALKASGIRIIMATGDGLTTARAVGRKLQLDEVHSEMRPRDKAELDLLDVGDQAVGLGTIGAVDLLDQIQIGQMSA